MFRADRVQMISNFYVKLLATQAQLLAARVMCVVSGTKGARVFAQDDTAPIQHLSLFETLGLGVESSPRQVDENVSDRMHYIEISVAMHKRHCNWLRLDIHKALDGSWPGCPIRIN